MCKFMAEILITEKEGQHIVKIASRWAQTPYVWGGTTKTGADCSGTTWAIYREAGYTYESKYRPSSQFPLNPRFRKAPDNTPQEGDVGWWIGHVAIYAGNSEIWTAHRTAGPAYSKETLQKWVKRRGPVKWYRYLKADDVN
jgi:cell wall-associated NlpC family hydrolase